MVDLWSIILENMETKVLREASSSVDFVQEQMHRKNLGLDYLQELKEGLQIDGTSYEEYVTLYYQILDEVKPHYEKLIQMKKEFAKLQWVAFMAARIPINKAVCRTLDRAIKTLGDYLELAEDFIE